MIEMLSFIAHHTNKISIAHLQNNTINYVSVVRQFNFYVVGVQYI